MLTRGKVFALLGAAIVAAACRPALATTITQWSFSATTAAPDNSPAPSTGTGTATTLGMTNSYNGGNTASDDVLSTAGTADSGFSEFTWRIRGAQTPTGHNGWATYQNGAGAPEYSQGIELDASTAGYTGISFSFDWYSTTQGIRDLQVQYDLNTANAAGWTNIGGTSPTGTYVTVGNDYYNPTSPPGTITVSLPGTASNDPTLGVRLVSAFDSTGTLGNEYASASTTSGIVAYNNSSGNWRFDNLTFSGTTGPTFATTGPNNTYGTAITTAVDAGDSLVGITSGTQRGDANGALGTTATILYGTQNTAGNISQQWRTHSTAENSVPVFSDVLNITGITLAPGAVYVLEMSYNPADLVPAIFPQNDLALGEFVNGNWTLAAANDAGGTATPTFFSGAWNNQLGLGDYGVDTVNDEVWAVLDHDAIFAVIPEPASIGLLGVSGLVMLLRRKRRA